MVGFRPVLERGAQIRANEIYLTSYAAADESRQDLLNVTSGDVFCPYRAQVGEGLLDRACEGRLDMPCANSAAVSQVLDIRIEKLLECAQARRSLPGKLL